MPRRRFHAMALALFAAVCLTTTLNDPPLSACPRRAKQLVSSTADASTRLADLGRRMQTVSTADKDSFRQAQSILNEAFSLTDPVELRERAVDVWLREYYERAIERGNLLETLGVTSPLTQYRQLSSIRRRTKPLGFDADVEDGEVALQARPALLNARVGKLAGPAWQAYWRLQARENGKPISADGQVSVPWDDMRQRLIVRERFLTTYPKFVRRAAVEQEIPDIVFYYLGANDPVFLGDARGQLRTEIRASYDQFLAQNADSPSYKLIRDFYGMIRAHNGRVDDAALSRFLRSQGLTSGLSIAPENAGE